MPGTHIGIIPPTRQRILPIDPCPRPPITSPHEIAPPEDNRKMKHADL